MINASIQQQQQQVDDKKATNANYVRKSQVNLNLTHYNNTAAINRSIFIDSNYYVSRDHHKSIDSPDNSVISTEKSVSTNLYSNQIASSQRLSKSEAKQQQQQQQQQQHQQQKQQLQQHNQSSHPANDQISLLFPKCRPRNDSNLNKTGNFVDNNTVVQLTPASNLLASSPSSGDYKNQNKSFIDIESPRNSANDNNRAHIRNMKNHKNTENSERMQNNMMGIDDSASFRTKNYDGHTMRNNAINYQRTTNNTQHQYQHQQQQQQLHQLNNDCHKLSGFESGNHMAKIQSKWENSSNDIRKWADCDETERDNIFWNKRHRSPTTTPASTVLNSPDFTETHHYSHHSAQHQIKVGRSPVNQHDHNNIEKHSTSPELYVRNVKRTPTTTATTATNMVSGINSCHLDEIDNWCIKNERNNPFRTKHEILQSQTNENHRRFNPMLLDDEYDYESDSKLFSTDNVTKMIGALPIAEYEGSPRRFGNNQHELPIHQHEYQYTGNTNLSEWERPPSSRKMLTSPTFVPPRPGFPKRVTSSPSMESVTKKVSDENKTVNVASQSKKQNQSSSSSSNEVTPSPIIVPKSVETKTIPEEKSPADSMSDNNITQNPHITLLDNNDSGGVSNEATDTKNSSAYSTTFDYLYEFSETRKVLEDFFKCPNNEDEKKIVDCFNESDTGSFDNLNEIDSKESEINYIDPHLTTVHSNNKDYDNDTTYQPNRITKNRYPTTNDYSNQQINDEYENNDVELYLDSNSRSSGELGDTELDVHHHRRYSRHFTLSPETTDYDSNCGDLDSLSNDLNGCIGINSNSGNAINCSTIISDYSRLYTSMPVLEDGLSSGHASDTENNNPVTYLTNNGTSPSNNVNISSTQINHILDNKNTANDSNNVSKMLTPIPVNLTGNSPNLANSINLIDVVCPTPSEDDFGLETIGDHDQQQLANDEKTHVESKSYLDSEIGSIFPTASLAQTSASHNSLNNSSYQDDRNDIAHAQIKELRNSMQSKSIQSSYQQLHQQQQSPIDENALTKNVEQEPSASPIWLPRHQHNQSHESLNSEHILSKPLSADDEEADTDLETDRLLGQQRLDDHGFYDDKSSSNWCDRPRSIKSPSSTLKTSKTIQQQHSQTFSSASIRQGIGSSSSIGVAAACANIPLNLNSSPSTNHSTNQQMLMNQSLNHQNDKQDNMCLASPDKSHISNLQRSPSDSLSSKTETDKNRSTKSRNKEGRYWEPAVLIEGVLFRARYLGSTQLVCEGQPTKSTRMMQAEEAVSRIKAPEGETQPSTEVDLFISTEKIMVLNTDLKEIMMDHALRTISYIADIGDLVVLMARRRFVPSDTDDAPKLNRTPKMICHVFESDEAQFIAQSIGQAFQVAYMEFLKANGIEDHSFVKEMDYQEVLNSQEIFGDELEIFAKKELQKEVVVPKTKGEILGMVIVESGWGSMLPTVVIANLLSTGAAARCGQLNIGDQIIAINGLSLVGLPLSTCQSYIRNTKNQTAVKFTVVPCPPVVEVKIKRPNTKYQLGFSVQNGVICSLLRGGIAERGGVRVGHRIIEINNQSVVAVPHEKIVNLLATSVGEILMKTMPTSMFRLLTGQENPLYI